MRKLEILPYILTFSVVLLASIIILNSAIFYPSASGAEQVTPNINQNASTTAKFSTFNGAKYGATIQYPESWKINEDSNGVWFVSPVDETGNIRIESQTAINGSLVLTVQAQLMQSKNSYKELNIVSSNSTTLDGIPANRTDYTFKVEFPRFLGSDIFDYSAFQISALKGDKVYTFTYFSTPENFHLFLPIAQKMLDSLKIL